MFVKYYNEGGEYTAYNTHVLNIFRVKSVNKIDPQGIDISGNARMVSCGNTVTYILLDDQTVFAIPIELLNGTRLSLDENHYDDMSSITPIKLNTDVVNGNIIHLAAQHDDCVILDEYGKYYRCKLNKDDGTMDLIFTDKTGEFNDISNMGEEKDYDKGFASIRVDDTSMQLITNKDQQLI